MTNAPASGLNKIHIPIPTAWKEKRYGNDLLHFLSFHGTIGLSLLSSLFSYFFYGFYNIDYRFYELSSVGGLIDSLCSDVVEALLSLLADDRNDYC